MKAFKSVGNKFAAWWQLQRFFFFLQFESFKIIILKQTSSCVGSKASSFCGDRGNSCQMRCCSFACAAWWTRLDISWFTSLSCFPKSFPVIDRFFHCHCLIMTCPNNVGFLWFLLMCSFLQVCFPWVFFSGWYIFVSPLSASVSTYYYASFTSIISFFSWLRASCSLVSLSCHRKLYLLYLFFTWFQRCICYPLILLLYRA